VGFRIQDLEIFWFCWYSRIDNFVVQVTSFLYFQKIELNTIIVSCMLLYRILNPLRIHSRNETVLLTSFQLFESNTKEPETNRRGDFKNFELSEIMKQRDHSVSTFVPHCNTAAKHCNTRNTLRDTARHCKSELPIRDPGTTHATHEWVTSHMDESCYIWTSRVAYAYASMCDSSLCDMNHQHVTWLIHLRLTCTSIVMIKCLIVGALVTWAIYTQGQLLWSRLIITRVVPGYK